MDLRYTRLSLFIEAKAPKIRFTDYAVTLQAFEDIQRNSRDFNHGVIGATLATSINTLCWLIYMGFNDYLKPHYTLAIIIVLSITGFCWSITGLRWGTNRNYFKYSMSGAAVAVVSFLLLFKPLNDPFFYAGFAVAIGSCAGALFRDYLIKFDE